MRSTMNVSLPADLKTWLDEQVRIGGFGTASEYVRDLLRRARDRQARRDVDELLLEAINEKPAIPVDAKDFARIRHASRKALAKSARRK